MSKQRIGCVSIVHEYSTIFSPVNELGEYPVRFCKSSSVCPKGNYTILDQKMLLVLDGVGIVKLKSAVTKEC
jgi:hypothetical protein